MLFISPYDDARILLIPVKLFVALIFVFFGFRLKNRRKYVVNTLFFVAFLAWAFYLTTDAFVFVFSGLSPEWFEFGRILWILEIFALFTYGLLIFLAAGVIHQGTQILRKKSIIFLEIVVLFILTHILAQNSSIVITDSTGTEVSPENLPWLLSITIREEFNTLGLVIIAIPFVINFVSLVLLGIARKNTHDLEVKKRMTLLILGLLMIPLGLLYFILRGLFFPVYSFLDSSIGNLFFLVAPFLISKSQSQTQSQSLDN